MFKWELFNEAADDLQEGQGDMALTYLIGQVLSKCWMDT